MSGDHTSTTNHNKEFLTKSLGLIQYRNSTIFENRKYFVLSPSVQNKNNWFDLRKINLDKKPNDKNGKLLIRLMNDFILVDLDKIMTELCNNEPYETKNSGIHWKFQIRANQSNEQYILNTKSKGRIYVERIDKEQVLKEMK